MVSFARRTRTPEGEGTTRISFLCSRSAHAVRGAYGAVDLPCSPNAHTGLLFFHEAVLVEARSGRSISPRPKGVRASLEATFQGGAPSTGAVGTTCVLFLEGNKRAWKDHLYSRCSPGQSARRWEIDCSQSVGRVGGKNGAGSGRVKNVRAVGDQSTLPRRENERAGEKSAHV